MSEPYDLLIRHGEVILPGGRQRVDIAVRDGRIAAIAPAIDGTAIRTIDASGMQVFPGVIDPHTHMGIPIKTTTSADDFRTGSEAAASGGVTTILDFTVQKPGESPTSALERRLGAAESGCRIDYAVHVNLTDRQAHWLPQIPDLIAAGHTSFKVFSTYRDAGMMIDWTDFRTVLETIHRHGGLLMLHAEDNGIVERETARHVSAGYRSPIWHARSRPAEAEAEAIRVAAAIAGELGARLYIVHLSSAAGLAAALSARRQGARLILETCPQYLLLDESRFDGPRGHDFIATPPLRTAADREALWEALADGSIDTIGTDHCPFTRAQQDEWEGRFDRAPNGLPGVATSFPLLFTHGVVSGRISAERLAELTATAPARHFGIDSRKGRIAVGTDADLLIWDPEAPATLHAADIPGAADWSPYEGWPVAGSVAWTILRGRPVFIRGALQPFAPGEWVAAVPDASF